LSWINRFTARTGSVLASLSLLLGLVSLPAMADAPVSALYQQQTIRFTHLSSTYGAPAIGVEDPGFQALLRDVGAVLTWKPGERYVLITTAVPTVISFSIGDRSYDVGAITLQANFAPYQDGDEAFLPLDEVLRSLDLALRQDGSQAILQPQLASLDVRTGNGGVTIVAHGGAPLHPNVVQQSATSVTYEFDGVGTTIPGTRNVGTGGVHSITVAQSGSVRAPKTTVTVQLVTGATVAPVRSNDERDVVLAFSGGGEGATVAAAPPQASSASPTPEPGPAQPQGAPVQGGPAPNGPTVVTGVSVQPAANGTSVVIAIQGNANYQWHRLRDPDNRFWVDIENAQLQGPPIDENEPAPLISLRVRQIDPNTVRIAISLDGPKSVNLSPSANSLAVGIGGDDVADSPRSGSGSVGTVVSSGEEAAALVTPAPLGEPIETYGGSNDSNWKFGPHGGSNRSYVPTNPRLIVIDPGHGGSDRGASRNGVDEAVLTLDMAKRLRDILIAQGWQVRMTRTTDVDVYEPNDSAHDELQARDDVANHNGARLLICIHVNSFINSGPSGTTVYIAKSSDVALANILERHLESDGTKDDGVVKSHLYIPLHAIMPAVLIETAFLSNPDDFALLNSSAWRQKVVQEMADGINQYAQDYPVPNQAPQ
jgi:N-acetylmuramoyl-L-alanine amidase